MNTAAPPRIVCQEIATSPLWSLEGYLNLNRSFRTRLGTQRATTLTENSSRCDVTWHDRPKLCKLRRNRAIVQSAICGSLPETGGNASNIFALNGVQHQQRGRLLREGIDLSTDWLLDL